MIESGPVRALPLWRRAARFLGLGIRLARRNLPRVLIPLNLATWLALTLWRFRDRTALRASLIGLREGLRGGHGIRAPMSWRTVVQLTRCGRPPVV
ncbi:MULTISPECIES: hypothetical protein [Streptomyces]|uniref:hypothetical protein n=1 Tax=Streptomyces lycopersici TaxID=2974589 RepID=UPI0021D2CFEC|nr:hypothetical protein [Streptomyces sp. NEAU-383]